MRTNILRGLVILEAVLIIVIVFSFTNKIKSYKTKLKELEIVEKEYNLGKDYIYECYKLIESNAERSGR